MSPWLNCLPGYDSYWSCSTAKKGYARASTFIILLSRSTLVLHSFKGMLAQLPSFVVLLTTRNLSWRAKTQARVAVFTLTPCKQCKSDPKLRNFIILLHAPAYQIACSTNPKNAIYHNYDPHLHHAPPLSGTKVQFGDASPNESQTKGQTSMAAFLTGAKGKTKAKATKAKAKATKAKVLPALSQSHSQHNHPSFGNTGCAEPWTQTCLSTTLRVPSPCPNAHALIAKSVEVCAFTFIMEGGLNCCGLQ